jgi:hypothetical protein
VAPNAIGKTACFLLGVYNSQFTSSLWMGLSVIPISADVAGVRRLKSVEGIGGSSESTRLLLVLTDDLSDTLINRVIGVDEEPKKKLPKPIFQ